ncbi:MAG: class I SAM-dependent methyltransferase [Magnetococcus sp. THC-1_WYH]
MSNINTDQWNENSVIIQRSLLARIHRRLIIRLSKFYTIMADKDVLILDVGCGSGYFICEFYGKGYRRIYGIEPDGALLANIPAGMAEIHHDKAGAMSFPDATFDAVFVYGVLHHLQGVSGYIEAVGEMDRVLKPHGFLFIMEPGRLWMLHLVEFVTRLLGPFMAPLRALRAALEEERKDQEFFIKHHAVIRDYFLKKKYCYVVDRYFLYTWISTLQKRQ